MIEVCDPEVTPRIAFVGEFWSREDDEAGTSFSGASGRFLHALLKRVGISSRHSLFTNVMLRRPELVNDVKGFAGAKAVALPDYPSVAPGLYVSNAYAPELTRLHKELTDYAPTLIVALGALASWALLHKYGIKKVRGAPHLGVTGVKVLPTYSPAAVLRQYTLYPVFFSDLQKAATESQFRDLRRPARFIHVSPSYQDLLDFERDFINPSDSLSVDIETAGNQITCIGFAPSTDRAIVVPITDDTRATHSYWDDLETELLVWDWIRRICALRKARFVGQNFNYDMKFLLQSYGIPVPHANHDIMLLHHSMQPEMEKSLGFMASLYTTELAWKWMRPKHTVKQED